MTPDEKSTVLDVNNLWVTYATDNGPLHTVRNVTMKIARGEIYGLVGESGSGKTTLARALVRYLPRNGSITKGSISLAGTDLLALPQSELRKVWGARVTMVHQDPAKAINPSIPVGEQICASEGDGALGDTAIARQVADEGAGEGGLARA